ncbi:hypothetical protein [Cellulomonas sp. HZM]|uniref:hypothetical protein n=1 Tax=Cellulomonas sp. HZM TaxID=1454010 RepID=UPI0004933ABF|nr:hypothetical protein [Cellulomonas sp. HZM]
MTSTPDDEARDTARDDAQRALDAVAAADPAAGTSPDVERLRAAVAAQTGVTWPAARTTSSGESPERADAAATSPADVPADAGETAEVVPLGSVRARRPARWLQVAAAVAGVVVVGGGGYLVGTQHEATPTAEGSSHRVAQKGGVEMFDLPAHGAQDSGASQGLASPQGLAGTSASSASGFASSAMLRYGYGRTVFAQKGLSADGGSAQAWSYDAASTYSKDSAARVAKALGVTGTPTMSWGWTVGPDDGSAATVTLAPDGTTSLSYYDPTKTTGGCEYRSAPDKTSGDAIEPDPVGTAEPGGIAPCATPSAGDAPTKKDAVATSKDVLARMGVDTAGLTFVVGDSGDPAQTFVTATRTVEGQGAADQWQVSLTADGIVSMNGPLAPLVTLGSYDVVSPAVAVDRLGDPRFGSSGGGWGGVMPFAADAQGSTLAAQGAAVAPSQAPTTAPDPLDPGAAIPWPVSEVTIDHATLVLGTYTADDGAVVLAPTYELTGTDGSQWTVIAVVDSRLDLTAGR